MCIFGSCFVTTKTGLMFKISPYIASRIINYFRIRKFVKLNENKYKSDESSNSLHAAN